MINKQFLYYSTKDEFLTDAGYKTTPEQDPNLETYGNIYGRSIAYIADTKEIWTHGVFYVCTLDEKRVNELIDAKGVGEKEVEIISIPKEAWLVSNYEFTSQEVYNQLNDAITNDKIIIARTEEDSLMNVTIVFSNILVNSDLNNKYISASGWVFEGTSGISISTRLVKLNTSSTGQCTFINVAIETSNDTPAPNDGNGFSGSSINYSRADHVHPAQTSVTGNAGTATKLQTARTISLTGDVTGSASFDGSQNESITTTVGNDSHTHSNSTITSLDASKITSGTLNADRLPDIPLEKLPAGALERLVIVANQAARYQLTTSDVQEGDTVKQEDTGVMYFVVDTNNLANENGYKVYTAGAATSVAWSGVTGKPNTLEGYGVSSTDAYLSKPTTFTWANGTTAGPTGSLTGTNTDVSIPAIPAASGEQSGIVTTSAQTFQGDKTFNGTVTSTGAFHGDNFDSIEEGGDIYIGYSTRGGGKIYIGPDGGHDFGTSGGEYTGNAATATKVNNKLTFTGGVSASYDGSSAQTINIGLVRRSYTYTIPIINSDALTGIDPGTLYYPSSYIDDPSSVTIAIRPAKFSEAKPDTAVVIYGTRTVSFNTSDNYGKLIKQSNMLLSGSSASSYRIYCFSYISGSGSNTIVAVNCSEYSA